MKVDIFIRTYARDIEALQYCLKSIDKFCKGFRKIIITCPAKDRHLLGYNPKYEVHTVQHYQNDYLGQQITKLLAHEFSNDSDFIFFIDSDCVVTEPISPKSFMSKDGRPQILKTSYEELGDTVPWKSITEKALGWKIDYEYMRRLPQMYHREHLSQLRNFLQIRHTKRIETYIMEQPHNAFSEFNVLGAFCDKYYNNMYEFIDTADNIPKAVVMQYWSHDMHNDNKESMVKKIEKILA
jgi:hypothetical protein